MNGSAAQTVSVPLGFLGEGVYKGELVRDDPKNSGAVKTETMDLRRNSELRIEMVDGGGFIGRFSKK
jgi:alpha-glucosidase